MAMKRPKLPTIPPTALQLASFRRQLERCVFIENAALVAGIPRKSLLLWIELGRAGHPEFTPVVQLIDEVNAKLSAEVVEPFFKAAFEDGNLDALKFLYNARFKEQESRFNKKMWEAEDKGDVLLSNEVDDSADVLEAEARAIHAMGQAGKVH